MAYPSTLDSFSAKVDGVDYPQASHVNSLQTAVEALEAKVGVDDSAVATSIDYILNNKIWPIGSVFTAVVSTNPATLLGFGTWSQIASGKVLVGQDGTDADFDTPEETGGSKTATLAIANLPAHNHAGSSVASEAAHVHTGPSHTHGVNDPGHSHTLTEHWLNQTTYTHALSTTDTNAKTSGGNSTAVAATGVTIAASGTGSTGAGSSHTHAVTVASQGSGTAFSIMNPYFVCYFWKRTA